MAQGTCGRCRARISSLTALRQGVPFTVIYSEVWHYIFGHANYFLAADGLITDPYAEAWPFRGFVPVLWATSIDASS